MIIVHSFNWIFSYPPPLLYARTHTHTHTHAYTHTDTHAHTRIHTHAEQSNDDVLTKSKGGADGGEEYEEFLFPNGLPDPNNNDHESPPDPNLDPKLKPQDLDTKQEDTKLQDNLLIKPVDESGGWFGAWHFLIIFLIIAALVGVGYVFTHNRKKVCMAQCLAQSSTQSAYIRNIILPNAWVHDRTLVLHFVWYRKLPSD